MRFWRLEDINDRFDHISNGLPCFFWVCNSGYANDKRHEWHKGDYRAAAYSDNLSARIRDALQSR